MTARRFRARNWTHTLPTISAYILPENVSRRCAANALASFHNIQLPASIRLARISPVDLISNLVNGQHASVRDGCIASALQLKRLWNVQI